MSNCIHGHPVRPADPFTLDQCRPCWVTGRKALGLPITGHAPSRPACVHLGARTEFRPGCNGRLCLHVCDLGHPAVPGGYCQSCPDYEADTPDAPESEREVLDRLARERDAFAASLPPYPEGRFAGRGIVLLGEGKYEPGLYVTVKMLRARGWDWPIQVWHRPSAGPLSALVRSLPGVECVDADRAVLGSGRRLSGAWSLKLWAVAQSPFAEVLYLDADAYPVVGPAGLLSRCRQGWLVWPDLSQGDGNLKWAGHRMNPDKGPGLSGGQYLIRKREAWAALTLASWIDDHLDTYHPACQYGDQDSPRVTFRHLGWVPDLQPARPILAHGAMTFLGPTGKHEIVHRHDNKFGDHGWFRRPCRYSPGLAAEDEAFRYYLEWRCCRAAGEIL